MERFRLLRQAARFLVPEYRMKWPHMLWWEDEFFTQYLRRFHELDGLNTDRRWMMYQLLRMCARVPGDTAECGVFKGAGSYLIAHMNQMHRLGRTHLIFDSFEGLSEPEDIDGAHWSTGDLSFSKTELEANLIAFESDLEIYSGWIPDTFANLGERTYAFVHIDVDLYAPTLASIEYFYPRLNAGGVLLCDDYGLTTCPGATQAMDEFFADKPEKCLAPSGGSGFIIKGNSTATAL